MNNFWVLVYKYRRFLYLFIVLTIYLIIIGYIAYILGTQYENIYEYYLLKQTGCNIYKLNHFLINATNEQKQEYLTYFNNIYLYPPINITDIELTKVSNMLKVRFIPMYCPLKIYLLAYILSFFLIITLFCEITYYIKRYLYTKYKWYYRDIIKNYNYYVKKSEWIEDEGEDND